MSSTAKSRQVHEAELPNGLKLIGEVMPTSQSTAIGFFVRTGARDETVKESGISHFLEHMMFKGTKKRSALDITYELGNLGAQANAYTSEEMTVYYAAVIPELFPQMQELLTDMLRPALDPQEFDTEKKVILEEIALYQDRPHYYLFEHALKDFFGSHPVGSSVLGSIDSVSAIAATDMRSYFDRRYAPGNMILSAAGNFSWEQFRSDAERLTTNWKAFPVTRELQDYTPVAKVKELRKRNIQQAHVVLLTKSCSAQDEARYALSILATILGDSSGSKMYWELVDAGLAESADTDNDERDGTGCFMAAASTEPAQLDRVVKIMREVLARPLEFTERELEQAKTKVKTKLVLGGELPMGRMMALGQEWTYRKALHSLKDSMERVQRVTKDEIEKALKRFPLNTWSEYRLLPE